MILQVPVAIIVFLNFVFLVSIMCVLVTKLRSASRVEAQQYYKAAKALLVLNPLLGTTYVFTFYAPTLDASGAYIFECVRAILLSTQVSFQTMNIKIFQMVTLLFMAIYNVLCAVITLSLLKKLSFPDNQYSLKICRI